MMISCSEVIMMVSSAGGHHPLSAPIVYHGFLCKYSKSSVLLWDGYDMFGMYVVEVWQYGLFFCVFPLSLCHRLCQNHHITTLLLSISSFIIFFHTLHSIFILLTLCHVFSHPYQHGDHRHSDKLVVFRVFTSWTVPVFHLY